MAVDTKYRVNGSTGNRRARALWYVEPGRAMLEVAELPEPSPDEALVRTLWSGISRGTERLIFEGRVPASEVEAMRAPFQCGAFPFPVKYGYSAVGRVEAGPQNLLGRMVFALHPHQELFVAPIGRLALLPDDLPPRRATLAANMETALNGLWDSGAGPGDRIVVIGAGLVGLLVTALAARLPGAEVILVDLDASRAPVAAHLGARFATAGEFAAAPHPGADIVFHASASSAGLAAALGCAGPEACVVEMSWYGDDQIPAPLGQAFHSRRLRLVSSQVGGIMGRRRPRWDHARRMAKALEILNDERFDVLITHDVAFVDLPAMLPLILKAGAEGLATAIRYETEEAPCMP
jgi:threonine dehydrogenase-like Zn-dependent dehydrogenase